MSFILTLHDRNGTELNMGDYVKICNRANEFEFFAEVKYLEDQKVITPFHTFSFHSFEKVTEIPKEAVKSHEERYNIYYLEDPDFNSEDNAEQFKDYLMSWRECEHNIENRSYRIELIKENPQLTMF